MIRKFVGGFKLGETEGSIAKFETECAFPPKSEWFKYAIWEFNGKRYRPLTDLAEENLAEVVDQLKAQGWTCAKKEYKIKPSSIKYMVTTLGVEDFHLVK